MYQSLRTTGGSRGRTDVILTRQAPADPDARIGDAERDETVTLLGDAAAEGYLTPDELDTRLETALTARTQADLQSLRADLPPAWLAQRHLRAAAQASRRSARAALRPRVSAYLGVMAVLVGIWLGVGVVTGAWYPWPIWPALGWGISMAGQARTAWGPPPT
jgi:Domain of unknown function (DUF1707)/2TM domain